MALGPLLFVLFITVPVVEIGLFIAVGGRIGVVPTLALIVVTALVGASLVGRQGRAALWRFRSEIAEGRFPGATIADGAMILVAGALLLTPGFLTDAVGFALLMPPVRAALRRWGADRVRNQVDFR